MKRDGYTIGLTSFPVVPGVPAVGLEQGAQVRPRLLQPEGAPGPPVPPQLVDLVPAGDDGDACDQGRKGLRAVRAGGVEPRGQVRGELEALQGRRWPVGRGGCPGCVVGAKAVVYDQSLRGEGN